MLKEFRDFINRGNVLDLAIAVIIGGAFGAIVTSLVNDIITPILGVLMGGVNFSGLAVTIGEAAIGYGNFIQSIINFLIIAWVIFLLMKAVNNMKKPPAPEVPAPPAPSAEEKLLTEIRDLLKQK